MDTYDFIINGIEYTLVDIYKEKEGRLIQLDSDTDSILFFLDEKNKIRALSKQEEQTFRKKYHLIDYGIVGARVKDILNGAPSSKKTSKEQEEAIKKIFKSGLYRISDLLVDDTYVNNRLKKLRYRLNGAGGRFYIGDTVYHDGTRWVINHETVHGIVNKSLFTTFGIIEGITDYFTGIMLPRGNYSQNVRILGDDGSYLVVVNDSNVGQANLIPFAKQLIYALGDEYNVYEMFAFPHNQIKTFGKMYGCGKCRQLNHLINKVYYNSSRENYEKAQQYMLETIFNKKFEFVHDEESAKEYFEDLIDFGLLRGRIDGKDDELKKYYEDKKRELSKKKIDAKIIPDYNEKKFYPNGNCLFQLDSFIKTGIKLQKEGKIYKYQLFFNKDKSCAYIFIDDRLYQIINQTIGKERHFFQKDFTSTNTRVTQLESGNYLITGPDGITEEIIDTKIDEIINRNIANKEKKVSSRK